MTPASALTGRELDICRWSVPQAQARAPTLASSPGICWTQRDPQAGFVGASLTSTPAGTRQTLACGL